MIETQGLTKVYGRTRAVDDLTISIAPGKVTGFVGPNGAGKSTAMRLIMGLDRPSAGTATINGRPYRQIKNPIREVGGLLDATAFHPGRSARNHLRWIAAANSLPMSRVDTVLELVGLHKVAGDRVRRFSLGMRQRLGIAAALLGDPQTLILDEPVNGLDPEGIRWVRQLLTQLAAEGRTVFISSHLLAEMSVLADHLIVIGQGRLIADLSTAEFLAAHSQVTTVVSSPRLTELEQGLSAAGFRVTRPAAGTSLEIAEATPAEVGQAAFDLGLPLSELSARRVTLEEAFMETTNDVVSYRSENR